MAYTKIIPIRSRLDHCLAYIQNEDKTNIALNSDPPQCLQSAFSCRLDSAYADMKKVKQCWHKDGSNHVLGYHIILSFAPQEVTPEQAHAIGCEFVSQYLKQEYQSVVSTHIDKSHLHCHIVFNSVNLLTGHMYTNTFSDYFSGIRKTSDAICLAHGLSVINPKGHSQSRAAYQAAQRGAPTIRTLMRRDLDEFLKHARNFPDFCVDPSSVGMKSGAMESISPYIDLVQAVLYACIPSVQTIRLNPYHGELCSCIAHQSSSASSPNTFPVVFLIVANSPNVKGIPDS